MLKSRYLIVIALCLTLLAACSTGSKTSEQGSPSPSPKPSAGASSNSEKPADGAATVPEKPLKIRMVASSGNGQAPILGTNVQKIMEERFNIEIELLPVNATTAEPYSLFFAQGGSADVYLTPPPDVNKLIDQGLFRKLDVNQLYERMPVWMSKVESLVGDPELAKKLMLYNGELYQIPYTHGPLTESGLFIVRKDWMDKVGITQEPKTLDEFEAMLKAFTEKDPDNNGKNDTYGIHGGQRYNFNYLWGAFGFIPKSYYARDGKVTYTSILPEYKEALKVAQRWYKAGYVDPEFVTDDRTKQRNKWSEGKFGVLADNAFWMDSVRGENGVLAMVELKNSNAEFLFLRPFTGPTGLSGSFVDFPDVRGVASILFGKDASDEVVAKIMEMKEALASDWDLYKRAYYGVEGEHYTVKADGKLEISPTMNNDIGAADGLITYAHMPITLDWMKMTMTERDELAHKQSQEQPTVYNRIDFPTAGANIALTEKGEDILKVVDEYYINAVTGKVDIDATWDAYVQSALKAGLTAVLAEYQKMYENY